MKRKVQTKVKRELRRKNRRWGIIGVMLLVFGGLSFYEYKEKNTPRPSDDEIQLSRCIDGDTAEFWVEGEQVKVRFLAIDTPETVKPNTPVEPFGKEASDYTCNRLLEAKEIQFEYEESNKTDKYGRMLAWIWVDGDLLQQELINLGYAEVKYIYGDYKYTDRLESIQENAKVEKIGIWGE